MGIQRKLSGWAGHGDGRGTVVFCYQIAVAAFPSLFQPGDPGTARQLPDDADFPALPGTPGQAPQQAAVAGSHRCAGRVLARLLPHKFSKPTLIAPLRRRPRPIWWSPRLRYWSSRRRGAWAGPCRWFAGPFSPTGFRSVSADLDRPPRLWLRPDRQPTLSRQRRRSRHADPGFGHLHFLFILFGILEHAGVRLFNALALGPGPTARPRASRPRWQSFPPD